MKALSALLLLLTVGAVVSEDPADGYGPRPQQSGCPQVRPKQNV